MKPMLCHKVEIKDFTSAHFAPCIQAWGTMHFNHNVVKKKEKKKERRPILYALESVFIE